MSRQLPRTRFIALDTEATGLDTRRDLPVAVAAVPFVEGQPRPDRGYSSLINPGRPIPRTARRVHGITDDHVKGAPPPDQAVRRLLCWWPAETSLVGFHVHFDLTLLARIARQSGLAPLASPALDVADLARALWPRWDGLTLEELAARLEVPVEGRHTAEGDAIMAGRIYLKLVPHLLAAGIGTLEDAVRVQQASRDSALRMWPGLVHGIPGLP